MKLLLPMVLAALVSCSPRPTQLPDPERPAVAEPAKPAPTPPAAPAPATPKADADRALWHLRYAHGLLKKKCDENNLDFDNHAPCS